MEISLVENGSLDFTIMQVVNEEDDDTIPEMDRTLQCYPNPFLLNGSRSEIKIQFTPREAGAVSLSVYNLRGQLIENIYSGWLEAEPQNITWKADWNNRNLASGVYLISLEQSGIQQSAQKLLLLK